jgi:hypothetical protein
MAELSFGLLMRTNYKEVSFKRDIPSAMYPMVDDRYILMYFNDLH